MSRTTELVSAKAALVDAGRAVRDSMEAVLRAMEALAAAEAEPAPAPARPFATVEEVAACLAKSPETVRRMARNGEMAGAVRDGGRWMFNVRAGCNQYGMTPEDVLGSARGGDAA